MDIRTISDDEKDLPPNIIVVRADAYKSAFAAMAEGLKKEGVNLAVWNGARKFIPEDVRRDVASGFKGVGSDGVRSSLISRSFDFANRYRQRRLENLLHDHFAHVAGKCKPYISAGSLSAWENSGREIVWAIDGLFGVKRLDLYTRFTTALSRPQYHVDYEERSERKAFLLRVLAGHTTLFAAEKDKGPKKYHILKIYDLREGTRNLWALEPWSVALLAHGPQTPAVLHSEPFVSEKGDFPRIVELFDIDTRKPIAPG